MGEFAIADLGYGLSQVLPVLTQCSYASKSSTLLFEQPELHLHPMSARRLADVFIETALSKSCRIVAETHSPDLVGEFQVQIRNGTLRPEDLAIYRVDRINNQTVIEEIPVDADGDVYKDWRFGFCSKGPND